MGSVACFVVIVMSAWGCEPLTSVILLLAALITSLNQIVGLLGRNHFLHHRLAHFYHKVFVRFFAHFFFSSIS